MPVAAAAQSRLDRSDFNAHVGRGYTAEIDNNLQLASQEFESALRLKPDDIRVRYQLAVCYFGLGDRGAARKQFQALQGTLGADPQVLYYLGRLDLLDGNTHSAIARLQQIDSHPPFRDTSYYLATAYVADNEFSEAEKALMDAAEKIPADPRVFYQLSRVEARLGHVEAASQYAQKSAELRRRADAAPAELQQCSAALRDLPIESARRKCEPLNQLADPDRLTALGMMYGERGYFADALTPLQRAAQLSPDSFEIKYDLGLTYFRLADYQNARLALLRSLALAPNFFNANAMLGATLYKLKDPGARTVLERAHELNPDNEETASLLLSADVDAAQRDIDVRDYKRALVVLTDARRLDPKNINVHKLLRTVYLGLHDRSRASEETRTLAQLTAAKPPPQ